MATSIRQARFRRPPGSTEVFLVRHGESEPAVGAEPSRSSTATATRRSPPRASSRPSGCASASPAGDRRHLRHDAAPHGADGGAARRPARPRAPRRARPARGLPRRVGGRLFRQHVAEGDPSPLRMIGRAALGRRSPAPSRRRVPARVRGAIERIVAAHPASGSWWSPRRRDRRDPRPGRRAAAPFASSVPTTARSPTSS